MANIGTTAEIAPINKANILKGSFREFLQPGAILEPSESAARAFFCCRLLEASAVDTD